MKKMYLTGLLLSVFFLSFTHPTEAAVSDWQKGASIFPYSTTDFSSASFQQSLRDLKDTGANYVSLVVPIYQANDQSSDIFPGGDTPTDQSLISAINYAHSIGLKVMLKPHLGSYSNSWRATINASNKDAWFANYGNFLNHLGDMGTQTGVESICIGTELISMTSTSINPDNTARWNTLIANLRQHFGGALTYSANWGSGDFAEEVPKVGFWSSLDYIGISAYYPLAQGQWNPSVEALKNSWNEWNNSKIRPISQQYGKQVIFTEVGYRSVDNAHNDPYDGGRGGSVNLQEQVNDYQALFQYWNNQSHIAGVHFWNWESNPDYGGSGNNHYSPQNKPAEDVMKQWFGGSVQPDPDEPTPGNWQVNGSSSGNTLNSPITFTANVSNSGQASGIIVDLEIYNQAGNKIEQKVFENQTLSSQAKQYQITFTPTSSNTYTFKVGLFNNNWSTNYYWGNDVAHVTVGNSGPVEPDPDPEPDPSTFTTNIWWPTNNASVQGTQPFKAMLEGKDVSQYSMYWQVDGDRLNEMYTSSEDYPHKEAVVDVSGWNWKGSGPYVLNFVSKDSSGTIISQGSTSIYVH